VSYLISRVMKRALLIVLRERCLPSLRCRPPQQRRCRCAAAFLAVSKGPSPGRILVANLGPAAGGLITEYFETDNGNVSPRTVIAGPVTGFGRTRGPVGIALDPSGRIGVTLGNIAGFEAETFAPNASGNVAPLAAIVMPETST
jgi:hypothetical protein